MNILNIGLFFSCTLLLMTSASAENKVRIIYNKPSNIVETSIQKEIKVSDAANSVVEFINETFRLSEQLNLVFGGNDGPRYDSGKNEIIIPYAFINEIKGRFRSVKYSESGVSVADAAMDALMHTLFHELAHALIFMHEIPVVGKEEDAADSLASVLLIEFFEDGQEIAISAADLFDLESEDIKEFDEQDFWDEHSLDAQRFYTTMCHVYGSDPKKYKTIPEEALFSADRADLCIYEYEIISKNWLKLLTPYFKSKSYKAI